MGRSAQGKAQAVLTPLALATRRTRPPPAAGVLYRLGESPLSAKRGRQHPLGDTTRQRESAPSMLGVGLVLRVARGDRWRLPVALGRIEPSSRGHPTRLWRERLQAVVAPAWTRTRVVVAEAGLAANATRRGLTAHHDGSVVAMPRTQTLTQGPPLRALGPHRPTRGDQRRARDQPDGRRQDDGGVARRATLPTLGAVTSVRSQPRRHKGPQRVQRLVPPRPEVRVGTIRRIDAWRGGIARTGQELKSGLHLGYRQVTKAPERVARSVLWSGLASRLLVRWYGPDPGRRKAWSLCKRKERLGEEVAHEAVIRTVRQWQRTLKRFKHGASCPDDNPSLLSTKVIAARSSKRGWRSWHTRRQPGSASPGIVSRSGHARSADGCV
jgi:hypothetical protein